MVENADHELVVVPGEAHPGVWVATKAVVVVAGAAVVVTAPETVVAPPVVVGAALLVTTVLVTTLAGATVVEAAELFELVAFEQAARLTVSYPVSL